MEIVLGLWITRTVGRDAVHAIGAASTAVDRLDGVKMLVLAVLTATAAHAIRHRAINLPTLTPSPLTPHAPDRRPRIAATPHHAAKLS